MDWWIGGFREAGSLSSALHEARESAATPAPTRRHPSFHTLTSHWFFEIWRGRFLTIKGPATNAKEVGMENPAEEIVCLPGVPAMYQQQITQSSHNPRSLRCATTRDLVATR